MDPVSRTMPVRLYRFLDKTTSTLGQLDKPLQQHISVSPDEKWLAFTELDSASTDLMLVEHFK